MGPRDPFASRSAPAPPTTAARDSGGPAGDGPVRIQARVPEPVSPMRTASRSPVALGAVAGLALGLLFVFLTPGQALLVLVLTALGAALGAIARTTFADGVDVGAAWRALRGH